MTKSTRNSLRPKRVQTALYESDRGEKLFVPTDGMWLWHETMKPSSVLKRAKLPPKMWNDWRKKYREENWLFEWLYSRKFRPPKRVLYPSQQHDFPHGPRHGEFFVTEAMVRFREHSSARASFKSVQSLAKQKSIAHGFSREVMSAHSRGMKDINWLRKWIFCGENAPDDTHIVTPVELLRCRTMWNYKEFLVIANRRAPIGSRGTKSRSGKIDISMYYQWLEKFPKNNRDEFYPWVRWLYGGPEPDGWMVVKSVVVKLKERLSVSRVLNAAGVSNDIFRHWQKDATQWQALCDAVFAARGPGSNPPSNSAAWNRLFDVEGKLGNRERTRQAMLRVAKAWTWRAAFEELGMTRGTWEIYRKRAFQRGGDKLQRELEAFVDQQVPPDIGSRRPRSGVVAEGLFVPTNSMSDFRETAKREYVKQRMSQFCQGRAKLPCIHLWMLDSVLPVDRGPRARRLRGILVSEEPAGKKAEDVGDGERRVEASGSDLGGVSQQEKVGISQTPDKVALEQANASEESSWIRVSEAARILGGYRNTISRAANAEEFKTNGKKGRARRIDPASFAMWCNNRALRPERRENDIRIKKELRRLSGDHD